MKKLILILIILLTFAIPSYARMGVVAIGSGGIAGAGGETPKFCDGQSGYLLCEDFEAVGGDCDAGTAETNCRNTWTENSACDTEVVYDYNSAGAGELAGAASAYCAETNSGQSCGKSSSSWGNKSTASAYLMLKINELANIGLDTEKLSVVCLSYLAYCCVTVGYDGSQVRWGAASTGKADVWGTSLTPVQGTVYHLWVDYEKAALTCKVYVSETSTKPPDPEATITDTQDKYITNVVFRCGDYAGYQINQIIFDNLLVDDVILGSQ